MLDLNKANEVATNARKAALDVIRERHAKGKDASPSIGKVHAFIMAKAGAEVLSGLSTEQLQDPDVVLEYLFVALQPLENGSALRQTKDVEAILGESSKRGSKAVALAAEF